MAGPSAALLRPMTFLMLLLAVVAGLLGYRVARDSVAATIYHGRLVALQGEFSELTDRYNAAVTRSAVTELLVKQGAVRVLVRSDDGVLQTIETPYDPASEIFIDYAVLDGKLWIRRVFDENTPPNQGVLIDGGLSTIDWDSERARHGKIAYRSLTDGRWVVSVSGDGSVALRKISDDTDVQLVDRPAVTEFDPVAEATSQVERIGIGDVFGHFWEDE